MPTILEIIIIKVRPVAQCKVDCKMCHPIGITAWCLVHINNLFINSRTNMHASVSHRYTLMKSLWLDRTVRISEVQSNLVYSYYTNIRSIHARVPFLFHIAWIILIVKKWEASRLCKDVTDQSRLYIVLSIPAVREERNFRHWYGSLAVLWYTRWVANTSCP